MDDLVKALRLPHASDIEHRAAHEIARLQMALKQAALELEEASKLLGGGGLHGTAGLFSIAAETARAAAFS